MIIKLASFGATLGFLTQMVAAADDDIPFFACGLIGAYYPSPNILKSSDAAASIKKTYTQEFDKLIQDGGSEKYGNITADSTSFSVVIFSAADSDDDALFQYHYTSPKDLSKTNANLTADTKFPVGDLTMIFTVYAWLAKIGETWDAPITNFLPELKDVKSSSAVSWDEVTIGSLAGQVSGLIRSSDACEIGRPCDWDAFQTSLSNESFAFKPDTTPMVSYTAYQLLAFAMQKESGDQAFSEVLGKILFEPLNMTSSHLLSADSVKEIYASELDTSQSGEPGALSMVSSIADLTRAGHSILNSKLISKAVTRRWLHGTYATSNLRNGVGRPWEVFHSGSSAIAPVIDALTKSGTIGHYASYFGLIPEFNAGFAIVAHDSSVADRTLDLNVHADIASEALGDLMKIAAKGTVARYGGSYGDKNNSEGYALFNISSNGYGLEVQQLQAKGGVDLRAEYATKLGIKEEDLDFRLYPSNVQDGSKHQFVAVYQDKSAPADMGTPTCITWQEVGATADIASRFWFTVNDKGAATSVVVGDGSGANKPLDRNA